MNLFELGVLGGEWGGCIEKDLFGKGFFCSKRVSFFVFFGRLIFHLGERDSWWMLLYVFFSFYRLIEVLCVFRHGGSFWVSRGKIEWFWHECISGIL